MGIEKLTKVLPKFTKMKELELSGFSKNKLIKIFDPEKSISKPAKARNKPKISATKTLSPQEQINMMVNSQVKRTKGLFVEDFVAKKQKLIRELSKVCDKSVIARIEKADNPEQLAKILAEQEYMPIGKYAKYIIDGKFVKKSNPDQVVKPLSLEMEQIQYQQRIIKGNFTLAREKAMHVPSKNPKVIAIENILKEQYGCKFVSLKDNEELARKVLKAYEIATKNGVKTPKNVIASDFMVAEGENFFNGTILLNRNQHTLCEGFMSTSSDFHVPLHEILHNTHPKLVSFSWKKIPSELMWVKNELSIYSKNAQTHETFTELNTKRLIEGLNPQEQALFDYLNIFA